jgi:hypothetical protein
MRPPNLKNVPKPCSSITLPWVVPSNNCVFSIDLRGSFPVNNDPNREESTTGEPYGAAPVDDEPSLGLAGH